MRLIWAISLLAFSVGCAAEGQPSSGQDAQAAQDGTAHASDARAGMDAGAIGLDVVELPDLGTPVTTISGGEVSGRWCGSVEINGSVTIPTGQTLEICGGSELTIAVSTTPITIEVAGTLRIQGSAGARVRMQSSGAWTGLRVTGRLEGTALEIRGATTCINGTASSSIELDGVWLTGCRTGFSLANGAIFTHAIVLGGATNRITGGVLEMTDSTIDLQIPVSGPDCTDWSGGGATLDHVQFTGCHCPLHIGRSTAAFTATNSIFDGASVPVMIAQTTATFTGNHFSGTSTEFLDIGGGITANVAGNYWDGHAPRISSGNMAQFQGADQYSSTPFPDVGPR